MTDLWKVPAGESQCRQLGRELKMCESKFVQIGG